MSRIELTVIVPTYNEKENVLPFVEDVTPHLDVATSEILFVDDASPDGTADEVKRVNERYPHVRVLRRTGEKGLSLSVIDGFKNAKGDFIGVMDGDLSHDPIILPKLLAAVKGGAELAVGSRRVPGGGADHWPIHRRLLSFGATVMARFWIHESVHDPMSGYFVARRSLIDRVLPSLNPKGYKILLEIIARSQTGRATEVPFVFRDRRQGYSKLSGQVIRHYLRMLWELRHFSRPYHWFSQGEWK